MKSKITFWIVFALVSVALTGILVYFYDNSADFRDFFSGVQKVAVKTGKAQTGGGSSNGIFSFILMVATLIMQTFAFLAAVFIYRDISASKEKDNIRLIRLENAEIFLDLPLYFGLFGTVLSFTVMTFNPAVSRLIAYSSTLIGIIISVILRLICQYPLRQKLVCAMASKKGE